MAKMGKTEFIKTLSEKTWLTKAQAAVVNDIIEHHSVIGRKSKKSVVSEISQLLGVDAKDAESISNTASEIIASGIKDKLKHPFGSDSN